MANRKFTEQEMLTLRNSIEADESCNTAQQEERKKARATFTVSERYQSICLPTCTH